MTDNGGEFISQYFQLLLKEKKIKHILTKPYASSSNGLIERVNEMIRAKIRDGFIRHNNLEWIKYLPEYVENINSQKPARSKFTPNELWTAGYKKPSTKLINTKMEITDNSSKEDIQKAQQYKLIQRAEKQIQDDLRVSKDNKTKPDTNYKVGDDVRIKLNVFPSSIRSQMIIRHKGNNNDVKYSAIKYTPDIYEIIKVLDKKPRKKRGEDENAAEIRFKMLNPAKPTYVVKDKNTDAVVKEEGKKTPKYFYKNDLQLIPKNSIPTSIDTINRIKQLNRFNTYIPFVD